MSEANEWYEVLCDEFGKDLVHRTRRDLCAKNNKMPSYIELLSELCKVTGRNEAHVF